jgi:uncharacterized repeat protein (TIGR01451 family)
MLHTLRNTLRRSFNRVAGLATLAAVMVGGAYTAAADTPQFNNTANDFPTLQVAKSGQPWGNSATVAAGDTVSLLVWDHNSVPNSTAQNVRVKINVPTTEGTSHQPSATVAADNAQAVTGTVTVNTGTNTKLTYIPGSAKFFRMVDNQPTEVAWPAGVNGDAVVTTGVNLGNQVGCWQFAQLIKIQVKVEPVSAPPPPLGKPAISTNKKVQLAGGAPFADSVDARPGDQVAFKIYFENIGDAPGIKPHIADTLDSRLTYIPGSSYMLVKQDNTDRRIDISEDLIVKSGQTLLWGFSTLEPLPERAFYLLFLAKVAPEASFPFGKTTIFNKATASFEGGISKDTNTVSINVLRTEPVVTFSLRKQVSNFTLMDNKWSDELLASAGPGDLVGFRLILINTGNTPAQNVIVKDILPAGMTFVGDVKLYNKDNLNGLPIAGNAIVNNGYTFATLLNGNEHTQTLVFTAKVGDTCTGENQNLVNKGQVIYQSKVVAEDTATVVYSCTRGLIITKDVKGPGDTDFRNLTGPVAEGKVVTFRVVVQNNGTVDVRRPVVRDVLPPMLEYVRGTLAVDGEFMNDTIQTAFFNQGMIITDLIKDGGGKTKVITFNAKVVDCPPFGDTPVLNRAYVKADQVSEISDTATVVIQVKKPALPN